MAIKNLTLIKFTVIFSLKLKHLMVSQVKGTFKQFDVQLDGDINDLTSLKATATIIPKFN